jgi:hypothetical protein
MVVCLDDEADMGPVCYSGNGQAAHHIHQCRCNASNGTSTRSVSSTPALVDALTVHMCSPAAMVEFCGKLQDCLLCPDLMPNHHEPRPVRTYAATMERAVIVEGLLCYLEAAQDVPLGGLHNVQVAHASVVKAMSAGTRSQVRKEEPCTLHAVQLRHGCMPAISSVTCQLKSMTDRSKQ